MNYFSKARLISLSARAWLLLAITLLALAGLGVWSVENAIAGNNATPAQQASPVHPTFALLDADGENVLGQQRRRFAGQDLRHVPRHRLHRVARLSRRPGFERDDRSRPGRVGHTVGHLHRSVRPVRPADLPLSDAGRRRAAGPLDRRMARSGGITRCRRRAGHDLTRRPTAAQRRVERPRSQHP